MLGIIGGFVGTLLGTYAIRKVFKLPEGYGAAGPTLHKLEMQYGAEFKAAEKRGHLLAGVISIGWGFEVWLTSRLVAPDPDSQKAVFVFLPDITFWLIAMLIGAVGITILVGQQLTLRILGENARNYVRYSNLKNQGQAGLVNSVLAVVMIVLSLAMIVTAADCRTVVTSKGMTLNPMMSFGETQKSWSDLDRLIHAQDLVISGSKRTRQSTWQIRFKDGDMWTSICAPGKYTDDQYFRLMEYVSKQSGVSPEWFGSLEDADRQP